MNAKYIVSDFEKESYWQPAPVQEGAVNEMYQLTVYPQCPGQTLKGFGGAFTEAAGWCWQQLSAAEKEAFVQAYFGPGGLGYTLGRAHINSCDFSLGNYACAENAEQADRGEFSFERDHKYILPLIEAANRAAGRPLGLMLSPWSPPAFMKSNGQMNGGGTLLAEHRARWAACMAAAAAEYVRAGCDVQMVSVQNEPAAVQTWDSCLYSGAEEGSFAAGYLRPALDAAGLSRVGILVWDHNKESLVCRAQESFGQPGARDAVAGIAFHWYSGDHFGALEAARRLWPEKELWFTEGCVEYSRFGDATGPRKARMYAHDILGNLNGGACASLDWNLLLDEKGGPNHVGNFCEAPVMLTGGGFVKMPSYYAIGHFSRHLVPGSVRLAHSVWDSRLEAAVFARPDGSRAAVLLNRTGADCTLKVTENGRTGLCVELGAGQLATLCWQPA